MFEPFILENKNARETRILFRDTVTKIKKLTMWQPKAFKIVKDERFSVIQAFCGSGKTVLQIFLAVYDIITSRFTQKQLIAVPCNHIGNGFARMKIRLLRKVFDWNPSANFTEYSPGKIKLLREWLLATPKQLRAASSSHLINGLGAVCSQKALVMVWFGRPGFRALTKAEKCRAIKNLTLRVDEAHHIKQSGTDPDLFEFELTLEELAIAKEEANGLGKIIDYILSSRSTSVKLCYTTATFFRGDSCPIVLEKHKKKFEFYHLDWLEHWETLGISKLSFEYLFFDADPINMMLDVIRKNPGRHFLVIVPPKNQKWRGDYSCHRVKRLVRELNKLGNVCDLVVRDGLTVSKQKANKKLLLAEPKDTSSKPKFDIVLSCNLVREGTDWVPCDFILNAAVESSPTVAVQTLGRPFRRYEVKDEVTILTFVKRFVIPKDSSTVEPREILSDRTNMLLVLTMLQDMAYPTKLNLPGTKKKSGPSGPKISTVEILYGTDLYLKILDEMFGSYERLLDKTEEGMDIVIESIMDRYPTPDDYRKVVAESLKLRIFRHFKPPSIRCEIDETYMRLVGFDKVVQGGTLYFADLSKKDLRTAYEIIRGNFPDLYSTDYEGFIKRIEARPVRLRAIGNRAASGG